METLREEFYRLIISDGYNDHEAVIIMAIRHWETVVLLVSLIWTITELLLHILRRGKITVKM